MKREKTSYQVLREYVNKSKKGQRGIKLVRPAKNISQGHMKKAFYNLKVADSMRFSGYYLICGLRARSLLRKNISLFLTSTVLRQV